MTITAGQLRAARGLLGWSQQDLSEKASVGRATIADFEAGKRTPYGRTLAEIQSALEIAGVIFVASGEASTAGEGVRMS
ncbi:helix-turn-helix transcriptional regulator [Agrobacterium rhizogenes]|nr:helix-turn-helix transcriptional regulator [Rhizobium rhizogenes]NTH70504.1 helix-turn-helix transcriptional regulator [Rhizobium rhizogenes]NTJ00271.1 helix-turn-helix transcriptional regulator [Rhizobium rhizogenes]